MAAKTSTGNLASNLNEVLQTYHNMKTTYIRAVTENSSCSIRSNSSCRVLRQTESSGHQTNSNLFWRRSLSKHINHRSKILHQYQLRTNWFYVASSFIALLFNIGLPMRSLYTLKQWRGTKPGNGMLSAGNNTRGIVIAEEATSENDWAIGSENI